MITEGICTWTETATGKVLGEAKAVNCAHCQRPIVSHNNRGQAIGKGAHRNSGMNAKHDPGGWCGRCAAQICGPCCDRMAATLKCEPFEKRLEAMEGKRGLLAAVGVLIVLALASCGLSLSSDTHGVCGTDAAADSTPDAAPRACHLVAIVGQSNVHKGGRASELAGADVAFAAPFPTVPQIVRLANGGAIPPVWTEFPLSPTQPRDWAGIAGTFGPELTLARDLAAARPDEDWIIVEIGVGGTTLYDNWVPNGPLYNDAHGWLDAQIAATGCALAIYDWIQGGSDANQISRATAYGSRLTAYEAAIHDRYPGVPFVYDRLDLATVAPYVDRVRAGEEALVGGYMVDEDGVVLRPDGFHWNTPGALTMGDRESAVIVELVP